MSATAKVFMSGRSQAVRLPKEFRFDVDEVLIERRPEGVLLRAKSKLEQLDAYLQKPPVVDSSFLRNRFGGLFPELQIRDPFADWDDETDTDHRQTETFPASVKKATAKRKAKP